MASIASESAVAVARETSSRISHSGQQWREASAYRRTLLRTCQVAIAILLFKVLLLILFEYRLYFPADFDAAFLAGRRHTFVGWYRIGFYIHIVAGPIAILLATFLMASAGVYRFRRSHRIAGRMLGVLVIFVLLPSSLVMAAKAYAGSVASVGFTALAVLTAAACVLAATEARAKKMVSHRRWATRCFLLLCSPLILRLMSGVAIVTGMESDLTYRMNAWLSWLIPLLAYEAWLYLSTGSRFSRLHEVIK